MDIVRVDVQDDDQVHAFWAATREAQVFERPYGDFWSLQAATAAWRSPNGPFEQHLLTVRNDAEVVGTSQLTLPKRDNVHLAYLGVAVRPEHRRRGVGTALMEAALHLAREADRTTLISEVDMPLADPPQSAGSKFLEKHGFTSANLEIHRVLELPVGQDRLDALGATAAPYHSEYRLVSFEERVPDEYMAGFCELQAAFNSEAPMGELDVEPEVWDEQRVRENEDRRARQGTRTRVAVALAADGAMVALTEMGTSDDQPERGWQSGTLVLREHRGHRLGLAIKVANLRTLQADFPAVRLVHSWNAESNGPMVAINDQLGFRPVEYLAEMQKKF